ncbi:MAG TPA: hypothetical protein GXX51_10060 [Firmicutes bacterium]|nr:hypothetical protein [Bacillota bacterium]
MRKTTIMRGKIGPEKRDGGPSVPSPKPEHGFVTGASWEKALSMFLLVKKAQGARERTIIDYRKVVGLFFKRFPDAFNS